MFHKIVCGEASFDVPKDVLMRVGLFERIPTLLTDTYVVMNEVSPDVVTSFVDAISGRDIIVTAENYLGLALLSGEFQYTALKERLSRSGRSKVM